MENYDNDPKASDEDHEFTMKKETWHKHTLVETSRNRDLGFTIDTNFHSKEHTNPANLRSLLSDFMLKGTFKYLTPHIFSMLFNQFVRHLEYCSQVFNNIID